jgi:hypothetical protein
VGFNIHSSGNGSHLCRISPPLLLYLSFSPALIGAVNGKVKCRSLTDLYSVCRLDCFHENMMSGFVMGLAIWWPARRMRDAEVSGHETELCNVTQSFVNPDLRSKKKKAICYMLAES